MATVLIVDDDLKIRDALCELFAGEHVCDAVETVVEAMVRLETGRYDVVLSDSSGGVKFLEQVSMQG
ncbi:MAG: hypothetical protein ACRD8U_08890 [Pyrinomonadaceae bacterium]